VKLNQKIKIERRGPMPKGNPNPTKPTLGGKREGAGRPRGSKSIYSDKAIKKLEELSFDPIEQMISKYHHIEKSLGILEEANKHTSGAYAQLLATQGQLINNLMQYGYRRVPEKSEVVVEQRKPVSVVLTKKLPEFNITNSKELKEA